MARVKGGSEMIGLGFETPGVTMILEISLEYVFVSGTSTSYNVGAGDQDPLQWPGVRPPDLTLVSSLSAKELEEAVSSPSSCLLKK